MPAKPKVKTTISIYDSTGSKNICEEQISSKSNLEAIDNVKKFIKQKQNKFGQEISININIFKNR